MWRIEGLPLLLSSPIELLLFFSFPLTPCGKKWEDTSERHSHVLHRFLFLVTAQEKRHLLTFWCLLRAPSRFGLLLNLLLPDAGYSAPIGCWKSMLYLLCLFASVKSTNHWKWWNIFDFTGTVREEKTDIRRPGLEHTNNQPSPKGIRN